FHPLELYPFFRRWPHGILRDIVYTFIWNLQFVAVFTGLAMLFDPWKPFDEVLLTNFVLAQCVGYVIHALFVIGEWLAPGMDRRPLAVRFAYYATVPIVGIIAGWWLGAALMGWTVFLRAMFTAPTIAGMALLSILI